MRLTPQMTPATTLAQRRFVASATRNRIIIIESQGTITAQHVPDAGRQEELHVAPFLPLRGSCRGQRKQLVERAMERAALAELTREEDDEAQQPACSEAKQYSSVGDKEADHQNPQERLRIEEADVRSRLLELMRPTLANGTRAVPPTSPALSQRRVSSKSSGQRREA
jgi:hypothetical protein